MGKHKKKAPIPPLMTLKVGPKRYEVYAAENLVNAGEQPLAGQCNSYTGHIYVDHEIFPSSQRSTLFHEAIHAVDHVYRVGLSEEQVGLLEIGMLSLIDDNPQLLAFEGVQ